MELLRTLVASLGSPGAVRNAEHAIRAREAEDRAIEGLARAVALLDTPTLASAAA
jgi:hypothetical protein